MNEEETKQIITQLEKQKIYKSWRELCEAMGWKYMGGSTRKKYLKRLESLCRYYKDGNKFIIDKIYEEPLPIEDNRGKTRHKQKHYEQYLPNEKYNCSIGVYKITLDNQIYIGSTKVGFRTRFIQHIANNLPKTKEMLDNGGTFDILQICDGMEENEIRHIEQQWIEEYRNNPDWIVVNSLDHVSIKGEKHNKQIKSKKQKYKKIKVKEEDYNKVIELLLSNNIDVTIPNKNKK